jgi:CRISPR/Cas system-associated exonuclease Cas4 (RecB family)
VPQQGFHCIVDFEDVSFDSCISCAETQGRCQFTASILRGMAAQSRSRDEGRVASSEWRAASGQAAGEREPAGVGQAPPEKPGESKDGGALADADDVIPKLSVTALVGCTRQAYLKATEPYYQRPDQQYWAYRGTLGHVLVERGAGEGIVAEQRFDRDLHLPNGRRVTITGQPDEIDPARSLLLDYKTTDRAPRTLSPMHIAQLNVYRWLVAPRYQIEKLGIVYLTMRETKKVAVPIWPDGQVERFLAERAGPLAEAYSGGAWPDLTEDTWLCRYCPVAAVCEAGVRHPESDVSRDEGLANAV